MDTRACVRVCVSAWFIYLPCQYQRMKERSVSNDLEGIWKKAVSAHFKVNAPVFTCRQSGSEMRFQITTSRNTTLVNTVYLKCFFFIF